MLHALEAERLKLARHRAAWFLVWGYPIGITAVFLIAMAVRLATGGPPDAPGVPETAAAWSRQTAMVWQAPQSAFGRYLVAAFTAVAFAGEYGWSTWKLVVPHRGRIMLLAAKYAMVVGLLYAAWALAGLLTAVYSVIGDAILGDALPAGLSLGAVLEAHGDGLARTLAPVLLTVALTALAAILTRSTLAAVVIGLVVVTAEEVFTRFAPLLSLRAPELVSVLFHALPGYHVENLRHWLDAGRALRVPFPEGVTVAAAWTTSLGVVGAWIGGLTALTLAMFRRQDIN